MLKSEQGNFFAAIGRAFGEYLKPITPTELEWWWDACKIFQLEDVERALRAHVMDPDDGKRPPRPSDIKRRLAARQQSEHRGGDGGPDFSQDAQYEAARADYAFRCARAPGVVNTAHAIALRHGNRPWQADHRRMRIPQFDGNYAATQHDFDDERGED